MTSLERQLDGRISCEWEFSEKQTIFHYVMHAFG